MNENCRFRKDGECTILNKTYCECESDKICKFRKTRDIDDIFGDFGEPCADDVQMKMSFYVKKPAFDRLTDFAKSHGMDCPGVCRYALLKLLGGME